MEKARMVIKGDRMFLIDEKGFAQEMSYTLDPSKDPKHLNVTRLDEEGKPRKRTTWGKNGPVEGDIHVDGNPHIHTDPLNGIVIARNILGGLQRVSPENASYFAGREEDFEKRVLEATMGAELVRILTPATAYSLLDNDKLFDFLGRQQYQGKPLLDRLGGWLKQGEVFRGKEMACYHKEWAYFSRRFQVTCAEYIEAKPGIPPTPGHVQDVIALMRERKIPVLFASNYFDRNQIQQVAARTGARAVIVPENTQGAPGVNTYFDLLNTWVSGLAAGFGGGAS